MPVLSNSVRPHRRQPNRLLCPWDSPGKTTGVGCHCLLHNGIFSSVQFSRSVVSDSLWPHESKHARPPCPSPTARVYPNSCPSSRWCHPTISSSVVLFSSHLQSFPASGSFPVNQFFASGGQSIGASASVLSVNNQDWFPLELTGLISLQSKSLLQHHSSKTSAFFIV